MGLFNRANVRRIGQLASGSTAGGSSGSRWLMIAVIAVPLAIGAFQLYKHVRKEMTPGEGDLVVNVNTATEKELETIPKIGPALARAIVRGRPYEKIDDLERVPGIGAYTLNSIRPYVTVERETAKRP